MNKKALILIFVLLIFIVAGAGFWRWESAKKAEMKKQVALEEQRQATEEAKKQEYIKTQKEIIDTSDWKEYKIGEYPNGCKIKYPENAKISNEKSKINIPFASDDNEVVFNFSNGINGQMKLRDISGYVESPLEEYFDIIEQQLGTKKYTAVENIERSYEIINQGKSKAIARIAFKNKPADFAGLWKNNVIKKYFYFNCSTGLHLLYAEFAADKRDEEDRFDKIISTLESL